MKTVVLKERTYHLGIWREKGEVITVSSLDENKHRLIKDHNPKKVKKVKIKKEKKNGKAKQK